MEEVESKELVELLVVLVVLEVKTLVEVVEQVLVIVVAPITALHHQMDGVMMVDPHHLVQDSLVEAAVVVLPLLVVGEVLVELLDPEVMVFHILLLAFHHTMLVVEEDELKAAALLEVVD